jgi:ParB family chromosome partitioning protein
MSSQDKLGRGLEALLGASRSATIPVQSDNVRLIAIEKLHSGPYQPRMDMDEESMNELADSIRAHGIIQPIIARESTTRDGYEIIAGERRWRAAQRVSIHEVPVIVRAIPDKAAMAMALIENIQREDLNPVEEANLLKRLADEFMMSHADIAQSVGKSRATITNLLRLLTLAEPVLEMLKNRQLEAGHAKVLLALKGIDQISAAKLVVKNSLNVRRTEALVKSWSNKSGNVKNSKTAADANITRLELELSERVEAKVAIHDRNGKGFIKIKYQSLDELDGILDRFN